MNNTIKTSFRTLEHICRFVWMARNQLSFLNVPFPCWLSCGGWFLAYGDEMGYSAFLEAFFGRSYEAGAGKFVGRFLRKGMCFVDIGANQGYYTVLAARCVGDRGKVIAFEPEPTEFRKLQRNLVINHCRNVTLEKLAVGLYEEVAPFYVGLGSKGSWSGLRQPGESVKFRKMEQKIPVTTLDAYIKKHDIASIDLIKIDVEGGELGVLKGGLNVFQSCRPVVMCEIADITTRRWGYAAVEICEFLANLDYLWFRVSSEGLLNAAQIKEKYDPDWENLVAVPLEKQDLIDNLREGKGCFGALLKR
jgi:FkbM family methyltransferase